MKKFLLAMLMGLGGIIVWQWYDWPPQTNLTSNQPLDADGPRVATKPIKSATTALPAIQKDDYVSVIERPLFLSNRRPPDKEADAGEPIDAKLAPQSPLDTMNLDAVIITPAGAVAWVRTPNNQKLQKVQAGDELEGWKVTVISKDEVVMEGQTGVDRLILRNFKTEGQPLPGKLPSAGKAQERKPPIKTNQTQKVERTDGRKLKANRVVPSVKY